MATVWPSQTIALVTTCRRRKIGSGVNFLLKKILWCGVSFETKEGCYVFLGIHNIKKTSDKSKINGLNVDFSYFIPNHQINRKNINTYEIVLRYYFEKAKSAGLIWAMAKWRPACSYE
jgi:hypothetical protein